ncbi:Hypothetical predicted protein [Octopus vulgaris]|uniref:Uncharacterized protein n=1 Tax=Octopus vulgaris TaxID=6645 RepID=A0AA36B7W7_OCTVU|nr:Hypothetical predicted protein [Octopus vulgaris]
MENHHNYLRDLVGNSLTQEEYLLHVFHKTGVDLLNIPYSTDVFCDDTVGICRGLISITNLMKTNTFPSFKPT